MEFERASDSFMLVVCFDFAIISNLVLIVFSGGLK